MVPSMKHGSFPTGWEFRHQSPAVRPTVCFLEFSVERQIPLSCCFMATDCMIILSEEGECLWRSDSEMEQTTI